jgi:hypothetical protein
MSIGAVTGGATWQVDRSQRPPHGGDMEKRMQPTADLLGLSTSDLKSKLDSGSTLSEIADAQGVSQDDLLKSIKEGLQAGKPEGAPELSETQLTEMASNIAAGKGPSGRGHHHGPPPVKEAASTSDTISSLADALGVDSSDLYEQVQSGSDLSSLLGNEDPYSRSTGGITGGLAVNMFG